MSTMLEIGPRFQAERELTLHWSIGRIVQTLTDQFSRDTLEQDISLELTIRAKG